MRLLYKDIALILCHSAAVEQFLYLLLRIALKLVLEPHELLYHWVHTAVLVATECFK